MSDREFEVVFDGGIFCEGPRWHCGSLWFSDIGGGKVWRVKPGGEPEVVVSTIKGPSGLGFTAAGDMLVASLVDATVHRVGNDGTAAPFCGPDKHGTWGTNDMATAGSRSYVTCSGRKHQSGESLEDIAQDTGKILMIDHDTGDCQVVASGYRMPNGIVVASGGKRLIVAELFAKRLLEFDIAADGTLSNMRVFAALDCYADGLCLDAGGSVWVGTGAAFLKVDSSGNVVDSISFPGWNCVAPALGGSDGRDL
jgi:sugar lactone lactonase YvrE